MRYIKNLFILSVVFLVTDNVLAIGAFHPGKEELKMLPSYCTPKARKDGNNRKIADVQYWSSRLGNNYGHIHHYCNALLHINRVSKLGVTEKQKRFLYGVALNNIEYSQEHASKNFVLNPEISAKKGYVLFHLGRYEEALESYEIAIRFNINYVPAYLGLGKLYKKLGDKELEKEAYLRGLKRKPNSKSLKRRLSSIE